MSPNKETNGNGGHWMIKILMSSAAPMFLLAYLLGAFPFLPSPLFPVQELKAQMHQHRSETRRLIRVFNLTCQGVWQGNPQQQENCAEAAAGLLDDNRDAR